MRLFPNRRYRLRLRSHPAGDGTFWYEGFATALDAEDHARDQVLARYPSRPEVEPERWDLWPCQLKLRRLPAGKRRLSSPDLIGEIWLSEPDGRPGGEVLRLFADYRHDTAIAFTGSAVRLARDDAEKQTAV
jgi:hypothetical protein